MMLHPASLAKLRGQFGRRPAIGPTGVSVTDT